MYIMASTIRFRSEGDSPPCANIARLEERKSRARAMRLERSRKQDKPDDFVCYEDSDSDDDAFSLRRESLNISYSFLDYIRSRELNNKEVRNISKDYGSRHILTHDMFKETPVSLGNMNKVFCSQWLSDRQVVFGTKCNKLMVYDVTTHTLDQIPSLSGSRDIGGNVDQQCGIHSVELNPSKTLLASGARHSGGIAIYSLPTLDPVCVGENAHRDWVFDMCWIDDQFLVSGSRDSKMSLWRIKPKLLQEKHEGMPLYQHISPVEIKECKNAQKVRALAYNKTFSEVAALSLNGYIHVWNAETFKQKLSRKLPSCQENVCIAVQDTGLYAIGCRSYTLLLDARTLQPVKKVSARYSGCGIRSASFQNNVLTIGTGLGMLMFYDLRAGKYLESSINSSRTVVLKASKGYVYPDGEYMEGFQNVKYVPAIYTHAYDNSGTRLFTAGGPLPATFIGNYAELTLEKLGKFMMERLSTEKRSEVVKFFLNVSIRLFRHKDHIEISFMFRQFIDWFSVFGNMGLSVIGGGLCKEFYIRYTFSHVVMVNLSKE